MDRMRVLSKEVGRMDYPGLWHEWEVRRQSVWVKITLKRLVSERKERAMATGYLFV